MVSSDTDLTSLPPHIVVSSRATISPESGIPQDFSGHRRVEYTITAEDDTTAPAVVFIRHSFTPPEPGLPEVPFAELSLSGTDCQWVEIVNINMQWLMNWGKVISINSSEELKNYIECVDENFPEIDFSENTLLLISGMTRTFIYKMNVHSLQQVSTNRYRVNVEMFLTEALAIDFWTTALVISKLSDEDEIMVNVMIKDWIL